MDEDFCSAGLAVESCQEGRQASTGTGIASLYSGSRWRNAASLSSLTAEKLLGGEGLGV